MECFLLILLPAQQQHRQCIHQNTFWLFFSRKLVFWMWLLWNTEYVSICKKEGINGTVSICCLFFPPGCSPHGIVVSTEVLLRVAVHPKALWGVMVTWNLKAAGEDWDGPCLTDLCWIQTISKLICLLICGATWCSPRPQARNDDWGKQLRSHLVSSPGVKKSQVLGWHGKEFCVQTRPEQRRDSSHAETLVSSWWQVKWWTSETERMCSCLLQLPIELTMVPNGCWKSNEHFTSPAPEAGRYWLPGQSLERSVSVNENRVLVGDFVGMAIKANAG